MTAAAVRATSTTAPQAARGRGAVRVDGVRVEEFGPVAPEAGWAPWPGRRSDKEVLVEAAGREGRVGGGGAVHDAGSEGLVG